MSTEDYNKKTKIINALLAYPDNYERNASVISELTEASESYVYSIFNQIDKDELTQEEMQAEAVEELQENYSDQFDDLLDQFDVDQKEKAHTAETSSVESVPVNEVARVRKAMENYREDAEFERNNFEANAADIAHEKYLIADRAITLLEQLESEGEVDTK